jgi:hypothetical protein
MGSFKPGDLVDVSFDVESREYNGRWYTDVKAWKMASKGGGSAPVANNNAGNYNTMPGTFEASSAGDDDLPF